MFAELEIIITIVAVLVVASTLYPLRHKLHLTHRSSALLSVIATGQLFNGASAQTPSGMPVLYVVSSSPIPISNSYSLAMVDLPFSSAVHLVGIPKILSDDVSLLKHDSMEPVVLEGDYPNYFTLYADLRQQSESRYVLDPAAMAFTVDFCQDFFWEIQDNTLYFTGPHTLPSYEIIDEFVRQIRPAIESPNPNLTNAAKLSYTERSYRTLTCPFCQEKLVEGEHLLECPGGHGCLLTGKQMMQLRNLPVREIEAQLTYPPSAPASRPEHIACPYCTHSMKPTTYQTTSVVIDICDKCGYRWLDAGELPDLR